MGRVLILPMEEKYQEYLIDEAKFLGYAESISFPETEDEICQVVKTLSEQKVPITIQSGKTGIVGGSIPLGGHVMNVSMMKKTLAWGTFQEEGWITVEPGINLMELKKEIDRQFRNSPMFWPPMPTETTATVGGILASNARGLNGCRYKDSKEYVQKIRMVLADGQVKEIQRGSAYRKCDGRFIDELDYILGGEGLYGIISQATLRLLPKPESTWGISFFFEEKEDVYGFMEALKTLQENDQAYLNGAEYLDRRTLDQIEQRKAVMSKIKDMPAVEERYKAMVYLELAGVKESIEEFAETLMELAMVHHSDPEEAWAVSGETEIERMHVYRHAAAETVNLFIEEMRRKEPQITKLGTDMSIDGIPPGELIDCYENEIEAFGLDGCIFGHILGNHFHVNLLPKTREEYETGRKLLRNWEQRTISEGGIPVVEHGFGKLKASLSKFMLTKAQQDMMKQMKKEYDPDYILSRGNIFSEEVQ